jgi:hypothetical protein
MKTSFSIPLLYLLIGIAIVYGITQASLTIKYIQEEANGRVCKEYNKNIWGNESIRRGCKTWA